MQNRQCFTGKIDHGDIAVGDGWVVGIGTYDGEKEVDCRGKYVVPGLVDGHVHIESSMLTPPGFAQAVMPKGTTTVIADPHEIANVCGLEGIRYMLEASKATPLDIYIMLPSCVPSTEFENAGARLNYSDLETMKDTARVLGLGEMMNYPGVFMNDRDVHEKLLGFKDSIIDGHAPGVSGNDLNSYVLSGVMTDHECVNHEEMEEKISKGMYIHLREGSATRNVAELCKGVTEINSRRLLFCSDDKHLTDVVDEGHMDFNVRLAISEGVHPVTAVQMATLNSAECYGLKHKGAIAPGYEADMVVLDDLEAFSVRDVYKKGVLVAKDGKPAFRKESVKDEKVLNTIHLKENHEIDLGLRLNSDCVKVIRLLKDSIITRKVVRKVDVLGGVYCNNPKIDILKIAVIERHNRTGNIGLGLVEGYGLTEGAIGLTIAHDSHNIIVIGDNDDDMMTCIQELERMSGGICIASKGKVLGSLQLEVAGLMTDAPLDVVMQKLDFLESAARGKGVLEGVDPFMTLAFLALPVVPEIKVTDMGLFDSTAFEFVDVEE